MKVLRPAYLSPGHEATAAQVFQVLAGLEGCEFHRAVDRLQTWVLLSEQDPATAEIAQVALDVWPRCDISPRENAKHRLQCFVDGSKDPLGESAFYDLPLFRPLARAAESLTPHALCLEVNRRRVARLLSGCWRMRIRVGEGLSTLVRSARFGGLLVWPTPAEGGKVDLHCCGPLQIFGRTFLYARALVSVAMHALVRFGGEVEVLPAQGSTVAYRILAGDPLAARPKERVDFDSLLERRCYGALVKAVGDVCSVSREPGCLAVGKSLTVPDFGVAFLDGRPDLQLEVVGFWTESYLERKAQLLAHPQCQGLRFLATQEVVQKLTTLGSHVGEERLFVLGRKIDLEALRAWVLRPRGI
jgi:predicted nuclease of restriction endonuclease-like RecB superfamily